MCVAYYVLCLQRAMETMPDTTDVEVVMNATMPEQLEDTEELHRGMVMVT